MVFFGPACFLCLAFLSLKEQEEWIMGKKLYVGNLSYSTTKEALENLFSQAGKVESVNLVADRFSGQSRGFGFVEMASQREATEAIQKLNGQTVDGRSIVVNEARAEERRDSGRRGGGGGGRRH
jgi:RNA recognition motif-containing protein